MTYLCCSTCKFFYKKLQYTYNIQKNDNDSFYDSLGIAQNSQKDNIFEILYLLLYSIYKKEKWYRNSKYNPWKSNIFKGFYFISK